MRTAVIAVTLLAAIAACGESTDCLNPSLVEADGRIVTSRFAGSVNGNDPIYWYGFYGQAAHSYAVEFVPTTDNENIATSLEFGNLFVWGPNDISGLQQNGCFGSSSVTFYAAQAYSPAIAKGKYGTGQRITFTAPFAGLNIVSITNFQVSGTYSYRITDTTLFNPRWSTWSGFDTSWGFTNMSDMPITGTLYVFGSNNQLVTSATVTVPANGQVFRTTYGYDLKLPRNRDGFVMFAHNGPPGSILGDAIMQNSTLTVAIPSKFESRYSH